MQFSVQVPLNQLSFGQVSYNLLYEFYKMGLNPSIFKASDHAIDHSAYDFDQEFLNWINVNHSNAVVNHNRNLPVIRVWHINDSWRNYSNNQVLLTFHETNQLTPVEANIAKHSKICVSSKFSQDVFKACGIDSEVAHLGFDSRHFKRLEKTYFDDGRITFNLCGKFEKRKHHAKVIKAWVKKYGRNKKYSLQCSLFNVFYQDVNELKLIYSDLLDGKHIFNVSFLNFMPKNSVYNDYLNSGDIVIGMSGGEGWGLPEFQSVGLGKHAVILNATAYKEWATEENAVLVSPSSQEEVYDGKFFFKGSPFNQGLIYDFNEDDFIDGCEKAIARVEQDRINKKGLEIQNTFKYENLANKLLSMI